MQVQLKSFTYSVEWQALNALGQDTLRAAIGQEVASLMPNWVQVLDELSFEEQGIAYKQFHEINDRQVLYDSLIGLQAMHARLRVEPKSADSSGAVKISTADAKSLVAAGTSIASGAVVLNTGDATNGETGMEIGRAHV